MIEFKLDEVNILGTETLVQEALYNQRLDQGYDRNLLDQMKLVQFPETDEKEADGMTQKLPPKLPGYKLFIEDYKCTVPHSTPRPNRDPLLCKKVRARTPWTKEIGIFWPAYGKEERPD
jgi:hypothetical protein